MWNLQEFSPILYELSLYVLSSDLFPLSLTFDSLIISLGRNLFELILLGVC